jgi:predicted tellurium resistance membrane protein TerC
MEWLYDGEIWAALITLTALEIVLGIDNIVIIAVTAANLPPRERDRARLIGLALALITRLLLLGSVAWIAGLTEPWFHVGQHPVSGRDVLMLVGGLFLLAKGVHEIHAEVEEAGLAGEKRPAGRFWNAIAQIVALDLVFSFDSVITAVGMTAEFWVMATAVVIAILVMLTASGPIVRFVTAHPTVKMLALSFVLLIGTTLVADGAGFHIPKGYLYFAMAFSVAVEALNVTVRRRRRAHRAARAAVETAATPTE